MNETKYSDSKAITHHYDPEIGIGNAYKFWADWPQVIYALLFGWEVTPDHPAQFHYALDYDGKHLNEAINRTTLTMFDKLQLAHGQVLDAGCGIGGASLLLAEQFPNIEFVSVTLSKGQIELAFIKGLALALAVVGGFLIYETITATTPSGNTLECKWDCSNVEWTPCIEGYMKMDINQCKVNDPTCYESEPKPIHLIKCEN